MAGLVGNLLMGDGNWVSGAIQTNPVDQTVLADTGPLLAGNYLVAVSGAGSVTWVYDVQHRDSANGTTLQLQRRRPAAGDDDLVISNKVTLLVNERFRIILQGAVAGEVQMSIFYAQVP